MSDTPRTDAWLKDYYETYGSPPGVPSTLDWAQKLEREVAELREAAGGIAYDLCTETTHTMFDVVIGLLDSHGWKGRANDLRTIKTLIPDVPITRPSEKDGR